MRTRHLSLAVVLAVSLAVTATSLRAQGAVALSGQVTSAEEGAMEGVLISVKKSGATITVTVASDAQGRYRFPATKLEPGRYALEIRAVGYELEGPGAVDIAAQKATIADLKLRKTKDLAAQLTNAEWLISMPGPETQKLALLGCVQCHTLERVTRSAHDAPGFMQVVQRMGTYVNQSTPLHVQMRRAERLMEVRGEERQPHDVIVDPEGMAWYCNFGEQTLGKLNPRTGQVTEYPVPELKPDFPTGALSVRFDREHNLWLGMMFQGGIAEFDRKTEKFQMWSLPTQFNRDMTQVNMTSPYSSGVDGRVWTNNNGFAAVHRLDLATGKFETWEPFKSGNHNIYDVVADSKNNAYFTDFLHEHIGRIDAKTGKVALYTIPTPRSAPRRAQMDAQDRLWFGEYRGNKIGMFDTRTEKFEEWPVPTPWSQPYDVTLDRNGEAWTASMLNDRVQRLDPKTGRFTEYLLPRQTNVRRVFVDNSTTPVTFWVGNNHGASIIKLEPLD